MYSSRQIPLFSPALSNGGAAGAALQQTDIRIEDIKLHAVPRLADYLGPELSYYDNVFQRTKMGRIHSSRGAAAAGAPAGRAASGGADQRSDQLAGKSLSPAAAEAVTYNQLIHDNEAVLLDIVRRPGLTKAAKAFVRAGPRAKICWAEGEVVAAIVTCGGLCPGLNDVIAELFHTLYYGYGVDRVYGIRSGFRGFHDSAYGPWMELLPEGVKGIYEQGGTVLGSSRGGFDIARILAACRNRGVNQLYIIGGDGTHRAANALYLESRQRRLKLTVAGIPKTIDNDIGVIDRSFGFNTAVAEARKAIQSAVVEASCAPRGLGIVQLMGRHAGYIAAHATLASRQVDLCLTGDHRVLTRAGWKSITRLQVGEEVLSLNTATHAQEWKPVLKLQSHAVDPRNAADDLFRMQGSGMDVIATRDHRMLIARSRSSHASGLQRRTPIGYETVDELLRLPYAPPSPTSPLSSFAVNHSRAVVACGANTQPGVKIVIPGLARVCDWWWQQDGQRAFLQLLGFWLRDGCLNAHRGEVCFGQQKAASNQWLSQQLLPRVFPRWWRRTDRRTSPGSSSYSTVYVVRCPPLYAYLRLMAVGPSGYNPRDPDELRAYPHFTKDEGLAAEEHKSEYYTSNDSAHSSWTEDAMLAALTAADCTADAERCWWCRAAEREAGNEPLLCTGEGCHHGGHLQCAGLTAVPEGDWCCSACCVVEAEMEGVKEEQQDAAPSSARGASSSSSLQARRSSVSAATTESSTSQPATDERRFSLSGYSDRGEGKEGEEEQQEEEAPARLQPVDSDALEEGDGEVEEPLLEAVLGDDEAEAQRQAQEMRAAGKIVWLCRCRPVPAAAVAGAAIVPVPASGVVVPWNSALRLITIDGRWFCLKRWLGSQQELNDVYSRLSRLQAAALLEGFCRADGDWKRVQHDDGEPTGQWLCSSSSFPLIDQLMLIGQLAGAVVDLALHPRAGRSIDAIDGRKLSFSVDHWQLRFTFTRPACLPLQTAPLAQPVDVSADLDGRGYYGYEDDGRVYDLSVQDNPNFLTQRLANRREQNGGEGVRAHPVFVGNCLIPEVPFPLEGELGLLTLVEQILDRQSYGVIVVAEGAGADLFPPLDEKDESGNARLPEIGRFLQQQIQLHFRRQHKDVSIKYHDPSYMIRSVPADAGDSVYCMTLAQNAVHGCMAGYTGFTSALVNNRTVMLPIPAITATSPSYLNPAGRTWERVVSLTHQPMWSRKQQQQKQPQQQQQQQQQHDQHDQHHKDEKRKKQQTEEKPK